MLAAVRPSPVRLVAPLLVAILLGACSGGDGDGDASPTESTRPVATTSTVPAFVPIPGGTDEDDDPLPPPVHAAFSVVVRGEASWSPYATRELTGLDAEAADALAGRIRQIEPILHDAGISASFELAYGPAAALCERDPDLLDRLEERGHVIGLHARTLGESFRAVRALGECGRTATTASGLDAMADPVGPEPTSPDGLYDAMAVLDVHGIEQVVGRVSPTCEGLGLAGHTNEYGTGAFTAPWRSAWFDGNACADSPAGEIVVIDQVPLAPSEGAERVDVSVLEGVDSRYTQALGWAADHRYDEPEELPAPGMFTWGVTVRLDDLLPPTPTQDDADDEDADGEGATDDTGAESEGEEEEPEAPIDPRTAPLSTETLDALAALLAEWVVDAEEERVVWMTPPEIAQLLRPR